MRTLIISISSDIGRALALHFFKKGDDVVGTYRTESSILSELRNFAITLVQCDLNNPISLENATKQLSYPWDRLIVAPGTLEPIGNFEEIDFSAWRVGIEVNFLAPLQLVHDLLPLRNQRARILFFAGAGTNGPAPCYSCYALSKIGLIKMCEQLSSEISDATFSIVGPGWVGTKIHNETLKAKEMAGANYEHTIHQLDRGELVPMERVIACCDWILHEDPRAVNGRNFSLVHDAWQTNQLRDALIANPDLYKLRRKQII